MARSREDISFDYAVSRGVPQDILEYFRDVKRGVQGQELEPKRREAIGHIYTFLLSQPVYSTNAVLKSAPPGSTKYMVMMFKLYNFIKGATNPPQRLKLTDSVRTIAQRASQAKLTGIEECYLKSMIARTGVPSTANSVYKRNPAQIESILTSGYISPYFNAVKKYDYENLAKFANALRMSELKTNNQATLNTFQSYELPQNYPNFYKRMLAKSGGS